MTPVRAMLRLIVLGALQLLPWLPGNASAATTCTLSGATLNFGTVASSQLDGVATFTLTCNSTGIALGGRVGVTACIGLGAGTGGATYTPTRYMRGTTNTTDQLGYQLYTDSTRNLVWGLNSSAPAWGQFKFTYPVGLLGGGGGTLIGGTGTATITVYGRIPVQTLSAGPFSSTLNGASLTLQYAYDEPVLLGLGERIPPAACTTSGSTGVPPLVSGAATLTVNATVAPQCSATVTATDMNFGSATGPVSANIDRTSSIGLTCINRTAFNIGLNDGANADGSGNRRMRIGTTANYIRYELYRDEARTLRWGSTVNSDTVPGTGTGSAQTFSIHGRVPPTGGVFPAEGTYSDVVTVTVTY